MFKEIMIEVSGTCNARCKYCTTGIGNLNHIEKHIKYMTCEEFKHGMEYMLDEGIISRETGVGLYNWGEPMLNPEISDIVDYLEENKITYHISTNCSTIKNFHPASLNYLRELKISMSGFSQNTYGRIHGFDINNIKENIDKLYKIMDKLGAAHKMNVGYHIYKFNIFELSEASRYFESRGIRFIPCMAYLADFDMFQTYLTDPDCEESKKYEEDLFLRRYSFIKDKLFSKKDCELKASTLVFDECWNIVPCCAMTKDKNLGSLFDTDMCGIDRIFSEEWDVCKDCMRTGQYNAFMFSGYNLKYNIIDIINDIYSRYKNIYIYGTGFIGSQINDIIEYMKKNINGFVISDGNKKNINIPDTVYLSEIKSNNEDTVFIIAVSDKITGDIINSLHCAGYYNICNITRQ